MLTKLSATDDSSLNTPQMCLESITTKAVLLISKLTKDNKFKQLWKLNRLKFSTCKLLYHFRGIVDDVFVVKWLSMYVARRKDKAMNTTQL